MFNKLPINEDRLIKAVTAKRVTEFKRLAVQKLLKESDLLSTYFIEKPNGNFIVCHKTDPQTVKYSTFNKNECIIFKPLKETN